MSDLRGGVSFELNNKEGMGMMEAKKQSLLDLAIKNPKVTNAIIAVLGAVFLGFYAVLSSISSPLSIGSFLSVSPGLLKIVGVFFKEVGLAAMVAVIINFSIEAFNRKRHQQEKDELIHAIDLAHSSQREAQIKAINQQIFQTVYERNIPNKLFKEIEEQLLRSNFLRVDSEYLLIIEPFDKMYAKIRLRHRYKVVNIGAATSNYALRVGFDVIKAMSGHYKVLSLSIGTESLSAQALVPIPLAKTEMHDWWEVKMDRPIPPELPVECMLEYVRLSPMVGKEAICTLMPTERMSVQVIDKTGHFSIRAMSLHPRPEIDRMPDKSSGVHLWELDGALFPGQGFLIDWMPKVMVPRLSTEAAVEASQADLTSGNEALSGEDSRVEADEIEQAVPPASA
ncbi:hypothetical protein E5C33_13380 [Stenotrophomonas maltophilia]|uniref:hypothetical protein n=1 Tax=Stenotrophomonas maltophilia TaxID=40324 RepID=UPI00107633C8|nr:hypothetical protein [Stenotrophomonas maltophilia]TFZ44639.1 hypothetical protein E5C33_13380 [Stenotrophomonas maltophilia]